MTNQSTALEGGAMPSTQGLNPLTNDDINNALRELPAHDDSNERHPAVALLEDTFSGAIERITLVNKLVETQDINRSTAQMQVNRLIKKGALVAEGTILKVPRVTESQSHRVTGGGGSVTRVTKCDSCDRDERDERDKRDERDEREESYQYSCPRHPLCPFKSLLSSCPSHPFCPFVRGIPTPTTHKSPPRPHKKPHKNFFSRKSALYPPLFAKVLLPLYDILTQRRIIYINYIK